MALLVSFQEGLNTGASLHTRFASYRKPFAHHHNAHHGKHGGNDWIDHFP